MGKDNGAHGYTEGANFEESPIRTKPHTNFGVITTKEKLLWIKLQSEKDLPETKGSVLCWVFLHDKVQLAKYQCNHFEVRAEFGLYKWDLIQAYQIINQPEPPLF